MPFSRPGGVTTVSANGLKWIAIYLDQRSDSALRENQNLCEFQRKTTNDTQITESKAWPYNKSSFKTAGIK